MDATLAGFTEQMLTRCLNLSCSTGASPCLSSQENTYHKSHSASASLFHTDAVSISTALHGFAHLFSILRGLEEGHRHCRVQSTFVTHDCALCELRTRRTPPPSACCNSNQLVAAAAVHCVVTLCCLQAVSTARSACKPVYCPNLDLADLNGAHIRLSHTTYELRSPRMSFATHQSSRCHCDSTKGLDYSSQCVLRACAVRTSVLPKFTPTAPIVLNLTNL